MCKGANNESFERKSRVTPLPDNFPLPMDSPFETLSPNMFRLIYEGDMKKNMIIVMEAFLLILIFHHTILLINQDVFLKLFIKDLTS
jgi:hypothetical protein